MTEKEIESYITSIVNRSVCVYRSVLECAETIVLSIYISGYPDKSTVSFEFDPISSVGSGEGWIWQTQKIGCKSCIDIIIHFIGKPVEEWENVSKSGRLENFFDEIDLNEHFKHEKYFSEQLRFGEVILPKEVNWNVYP